MRVVSVNVGKPRTVSWNGREVLTSIFKDPVNGPVAVAPHNLAGDEQSDLTVHGGPTKAVYAYPSEHYSFWQGEYPTVDFAWGQFGENLTVEGLNETRLHVGDRLRVGMAELMVTEPRMPCFKLGVRFGSMDVVKRFQDARRPGFYLAVIRAGTVAAGDAIEVVGVNDQRVSVNDIVRVHLDDKRDWETMERALRIGCLPAQWREEFATRLAERTEGEA